MPHGVQVLSEGLLARSDGLASRLGAEVHIPTKSPEEREGAGQLILEIADYTMGARVRILGGETMALGVWLVQFRSTGARVLELWEKTRDGEEFQRGASVAIECWTKQHDVCGALAARFMPPAPTQLVVMTPGAREGEPVEGVRYRAPAHMSGWWLITERYNGDIRTVALEHLWHLVDWRLDVVPYLALPPGWSFDTNHQMRAWFDPDVASQQK